LTPSPKYSEERGFCQVKNDDIQDIFTFFTFNDAVNSEGSSNKENEIGNLGDLLTMVRGITCLMFK